MTEQSAPTCKCGCGCTFKAYGNDLDGLCGMCGRGQHAKRRDGRALGTIGRLRS